MVDDGGGNGTGATAALWSLGIMDMASWVGGRPK